MPLNSPKIFQSTQPKRAATMKSKKTKYLIKLFQSTQPKRAATACTGYYNAYNNNFNPRSQRGLRRTGRQRRSTEQEYFNPRSQRGLRLTIKMLLAHLPKISIHAAKEGCDSYIIRALNAKNNFNPRSQRGLRQQHNGCS